MKQLIKNTYINLLEKELQEIVEIARSTKAQAIDSEMEQEDKWDTRRIEASYLAGAQAKRVEEVTRDLNLIKNLEIPNSKIDSVALASLVELESDNKRELYFISPTFSSQFLEINGEKIHALSLHSPLGKELIGFQIGDSVEVETPRGSKEYLITKLK